jgi:hypothetical protein
MTQNGNRQAFLILTQDISKHALKLYNKIIEATSGQGDVFFLYHIKQNSDPLLPNGIRVETFTNGVLKDLGYQAIRTKLVPGSNHFPVLQFFLNHPEYTHYWCIEDDVTFNGKWEDFFKAIPTEPAYDFVTSHIRRYADMPDWFWWDSYREPGKDFNASILINSFNPIYRISNKALDYVHNHLKNGCRGHHEVLLPTLLKQGDFSIADLGSDENSIAPILSLCTLGTMRWKPVFFGPGNLKNKLYHPVKANITYSQVKEYIERTLAKKTKYLT